MNPPPPIPPMILSLLGAGASLVSGLLTTAFFGVSVSVAQNQDNKTQNMTEMESLLDIFMCVLLMTTYSSSKILIFEVEEHKNISKLFLL